MLKRVGGARHVGVAERPQHEHDAVGLADALQELVAQSFALARAFDETADIGELHAGWDGLQ